MRKKKVYDNARGLPSDESGDYCLRNTDTDVGQQTRVSVAVSMDKSRRRLLKQPLAAVRQAGDRKTTPRGTLGSSDTEGDTPWLFSGLQRQTLSGLPLTKTVRRGSVKPEKDAEFHDSESEDIYDLYNACNGIVRHDGLLDVTQLNEYTPEEAKALNVPKLKEIWLHTKTGCPHCARVVKTLNAIRGSLREEEEEHFDKQTEVLNEDAIDTNTI